MVLFTYSLLGLLPLTGKKVDKKKLDAFVP